MVKIPDVWTRTAADCPPIVGALVRSGVLTDEQATWLASLDIEAGAMTGALAASLKPVKADTLPLQQKALSETVARLMREHTDVPNGLPNQFQIRTLANLMRQEANEKSLDAKRPDVLWTVEIHQADIEELAAMSF